MRHDISTLRRRVCKAERNAKRANAKEAPDSLALRVAWQRVHDARAELAAEIDSQRIDAVLGPYYLSLGLPWPLPASEEREDKEGKEQP